MHNIAKKESYISTMKYIQKNYKMNQPTLLISDYYGASYKEYGLFYGMAWCGEKMRNKYAPVLIKLYPQIYFYHGWNNMFNYWNNSFSYIDLLKKYHNIILYSGDSELEKNLAPKLHGINRQLDLKYKKVYFNELTNQNIYEVTYDSIASCKYNQFICDAELLDKTKSSFINPQGLLFDNGITQSYEKARSGKYSSKLTKEYPYGMTTILSEINNGEHFKISVWIFDNGNTNAGLVVAANDVEKYYNFKTKSSITENQWQRIEIDFIVPLIAHMQDIKIYCWNPDPILPAYFDDLEIEKLSK